jgi:membrane-associated protease RseP (regulator of RpoE activity)
LGELSDQQSYAKAYEVPAVRRRWKLPLVMFVLTILSTFWAGITAGSPEFVISKVWQEHSLMQVRQCLIANWWSGLLFSSGVIGILLAHEMGHYVMTRIYGVFSSYPIFIPFPFNAFGTCGAVIMMDGRSADRKEIFDIGIAGPLAGLVVAIPVAMFGLYSHTIPAYPTDGGLRLGVPLAFQILDSYMGTGAFEQTNSITPAAVSPLLMAAWIGLFVTGLNMMPMSQLDGGHVIFGLLGRLSVYVAYTTYALCAIYVVASQQYPFMLMLTLILLLRLRHPPSRNDNVQIGWWRSILAVASLALPILCIPAKPLIY